MQRRLHPLLGVLSRSTAVALLCFLALRLGVSPAVAQTVGDVVAMTASDDSTAVVEVDPRGPVRVTGSVVDTDSGKTLDYTNIVFYVFTGSGDATVQHSGTIAISKGEFYHSLTPGRYEATFLYLGYERFTTEPFEILPGEDHRIDVKLKVKPIVMQAFTIDAPMIKNTEFAVLARQQKAIAVQDAITAEQIAKGTDSNVAEALERVTGLSVVGGKYVFVRGLGDRYSSTSLNGASLSSPEPNRRTVPLDIFPAAMLDNVIVQKTYTPDMEGEFGGGNIDVQTRAAIDHRRISQKISVGYSENVYLDGAYSYDGGMHDWIGIDGGRRSLPGSMAPYTDRRLPGVLNVLGDGLERTKLSDIRESFGNTWTPRRSSDRPNFSYSGLLADKYSVAGRPGSYVLAASLSNSMNTRQFEQINLRGGTARTHWDKLRSTRSTLLGLTGAFNFRPADGTAISFNSLYTRGSDDNVVLQEGTNDQSEDIRQTALDYVERSLFSNVLQGSHVVGTEGSKLQWLLSHSHATRNQPDARRTEFKKETFYITDPEDEEEILDTYEGWGASPLQFPFERQFGVSGEDDYGLKMDWTLALPEQGWIENTFKFGYAFRKRDRDFGYRLFGITGRGLEYDGSGDAERLFDPYHLERDAFLETLIITERTAPTDSYSASLETQAFYSMLDVDIASRVRIVGGARLETSDQTIQTATASIWKDADLDKSDRISSQKDNENVLPALNGTWRISDRINLRGGYSKTLNRPEFQELAPVLLYDYEKDIEYTGNPYLEQTEIDSYDARFEFYPAPRRYMAFSVFEKRIDQPIEQFITGRAAGTALRSPVNGDRGQLKGWEVEWRGGVLDAAAGVGQVAVAGSWLATRPAWLLAKFPGLGFLGTLDVPLRRVGAADVPELSNWGLSFNFSKIESEAEINESQAARQAQAGRGNDVDPGVLPDDVYRSAPLTGQSTYSVNLGLFYGDGTSDFSIMGKGFGDRLDAYGLGSPDIYESVPFTVDVAYAHKIGSAMKVKFALENVLDQRREFYYDAEDGEEFEDVDQSIITDPVRQSWRDGTKLSISLTYAP